MKRVKKQRGSEPLVLLDEGWVEWGGELIWAMGFTEGGAPYGLTADEFEAATREDEPRAGWARAKRALRTVMGAWAGGSAEVDVGYVKKLGEGLSRELFAAEVTVGRTSPLEVAALVPKRDADGDLDARTGREARLLRDLAGLELPFLVPTCFGVLPEGEHLVLVRSFERGVELDLRAGRQPVCPWEVVGRIAAAIHRLPVARIPSVPARYPNRRAHALAALEAFGEVPEPEAAAARAWIEAHLPLPEPCVPLHGDLLGQNILLRPDEPEAVIDWEYAELGDPAYDLAIVTRGSRRPFQTGNGLDRLLKAYSAAGGPDVERAHVRVHELALAAGWYRAALANGRGQPPAHHLEFLRALLRRSGA